MRDLGVLGKPMIYGEARGINDRGQVVGVSDSESDERGESWYVRAFVWEKGTMIALPCLPGGGHKQTEAKDINSQGQILGWSTKNGYGDLHAVLWTKR